MPNPDPSVATIIEAAASAFAVSRIDVLSDRRDRPAVLARQSAMWLARRTTLQSYPAIGRALRRDHTTVMYGVSRIDQRMADDPGLAAQLWDLAKTIGAEGRAG